MSKQNKILLGVATFLPILGIVIAMIIFFRMFFPSGLNFTLETETGIPTEFITYMVAIGLTALFSMAMTIFYAIHASKNPKVEKDKAIWILLVILAGTIGHAIYFFLHVWPEPKSNLATR